MTPANYLVIKYNADPARGEEFNVGIIVWTPNGYSVAIDQEAVGRVVRENPHLERDALLFVEPTVRQTLKRTVPPFSSEGVLRVIKEQSGFPIHFTEARHTTLESDSEVGIPASMDRLMNRVVRPRRRTGGGRAVSERQPILLAN